MKISIENVDAVINEIAKMAEGPAMERALGQACAIVERSAKEKAPRDTGALRRSITSEVTREDGALVGNVFTPLEYAPYVEYGTGLFAESGGRKDVPWCY